MPDAIDDSAARLKRIESLQCAIEAHPAYLEHHAIRALGESFGGVYLPNLAELDMLLSRPANDEEFAIELVQNTKAPTVRNAFTAALLRSLHNYLASSQSLVDHVRRVMRGRTGTTTVAEFSRRRDAVARDPAIAFFQDLRNFTLHRALPPADERRAVFAYNRSGAYVERVLALAGDYRAQASASTARRMVLGDRTGRLVLVPAERATRPGIRLDVAFLPLALGIAESFGLRILSGYRDPGRNAQVGGVERSDHLCGAAADLIGAMGAMKAAQRWAATQGFAYVDGPVTNRDGNHGDHVHVSFVRCGRSSV